MNIKKILIIVFAIASFAQLATPLQMIRDRENTVLHGTEFLFKCAPRDPYNPFVGKYVALNFDNNTYYGNISGVAKNGVLYDLYMTIDVDKNGYARIISLEQTIPANTHNYLKVKAYRYDNSFQIEYPFTEYYMEEGKAPLAETAYWKNSRNAYATVRVLDGEAVMTGLYIDGVPVEKYIETHQNR